MKDLDSCAPTPTGDAPATKCRAEEPQYGFICTLAPNHSGDHEAWGYGELFRQWPPVPAPAVAVPRDEALQVHTQHEDKTMNGQLKSSSTQDATGGYDAADAFGLLRSYSRHIAFVRLALTIVGQALERRGLEHDTSKMLDDEFAGFARINAAARISKFGSPEYAEGMQRERTTIDLHFSRNSHHPERPGMLMEADPDTHVAMSFLDVIEMVCDWWGARRGYDDPRPWEESVKLNLAAKGKYLSAEQLWLAQEVAAFLARADA